MIGATPFYANVWHNHNGTVMYKADNTVSDTATPSDRFLQRGQHVLVNAVPVNESSTIRVIKGAASDTSREEDVPNTVLGMIYEIFPNNTALVFASGQRLSTVPLGRLAPVQVYQIDVVKTIDNYWITPKPRWNANDHINSVVVDRPNVTNTPTVVLSELDRVDIPETAQNQAVFTQLLEHPGWKTVNGKLKSFSVVLRQSDQSMKDDYFINWSSRNTMKDEWGKQMTDCGKGGIFCNLMEQWFDRQPYSYEDRYAVFAKKKDGLTDADVRIVSQQLISSASEIMPYIPELPGSSVTGTLDVYENIHLTVVQKDGTSVQHRNLNFNDVRNALPIQDGISDDQRQRALFQDGVSDDQVQRALIEIIVSFSLAVIIAMICGFNMGPYPSTPTKKPVNIRENLRARFISELGGRKIRRLFKDQPEEDVWGMIEGTPTFQKEDGHHYQKYKEGSDKKEKECIILKVTGEGSEEIWVCAHNPIPFIDDEAGPDTVLEVFKSLETEQRHSIMADVQDQGRRLVIMNMSKEERDFLKLEIDKTIGSHLLADDRYICYPNSSKLSSYGESSKFDRIRDRLGKNRGFFMYLGEKKSS